MQRLVKACLIPLLGAVSLPLLAITDFQPVTLPFTQDLNTFRASLTLPVTDHVQKITIPSRKLKTRAYNPKKDQTIEPISLTVPRSETGLSEMARRLANSDKSEELQDLLLDRIKKQGPTTKPTVKVELAADDFKLINFQALGQELSKEHHQVTIKAKELSAEKDTWNEFRNQLSYLLPREQLARIGKKIKAGTDLQLDDDLLPSFAKKMTGKFIIYRGPNCFHAALAFFDQHLTRAPSVNVKEEEGYHKAMINYDELWRVISSEFYEVDPRNTPLKYGDLMVFFGVPPETPKHINFKWIRHTAIYLFGPYTFSKGSKSPNTPYSVKTLEEEWSTWRSLTQNLGVKIYRRQLNVSSGRLPVKRDDWIY
ncbi:MAG: hypothetical protein M3Q07_16555 [Pseudobdellovibrionaceae bacterium]|nr:hypothetical protein [Pseudobdellovibrionaceae bacterium]